MALAPPGGENPSAAFLAGQSHGAQLAVQHHVNPPKPPVKPPVAAPTKPAKAPKSAPPSTLNSVLAQARAAAASDTNTQVAAIKAQQALLNSQALAKAQAINQAAQAAAQFQTGIGDATANSYNTAATTLAGIAGGYSGDLKSTATDAASQIQAQLAGLGAPAGSLKTATGETPQPEALSNVLYGLGGAIPANLLVTSGQAAAAAQRSLPAATLGYGQQQAASTITAGNQSAKDLIPQILALRQGQPKLAQQYLTAIAQQLTQQALAQSLIGSRATSGQIAQQNANTAATRANNAQYNADRSYNLAVQKLNKAGGTSGAAKASASLSKSFGYLVDASGNPILQNGKKVVLPGAPKKPTVTSQKQAAEALGSARYYHQPWKDSSGKVQKPLSWQQWLTAGLQRGISAATLIKQGRRIYTQAEIHQGLIPGG